MKDEIVKDLRQAIKELNSLICNPEAAKVHLQFALKNLDLLIGGRPSKPKVTFPVWLAELYYVTANATGLPATEIKINEVAARKFYQDGFTPYYCFRETWNMENDSSI